MQIWKAEALIGHAISPQHATAISCSRLDALLALLVYPYGVEHVQ
jgi:hypothetical protein